MKIHRDPPGPHAGARGPAGTEAGSVLVQGLAKNYGRFRALEGISFELEAGQALALWGANGAGKTTLLKCILGLVDFQGEIRVSGFPVRRKGKLARRQIGYVPQEFVFYDLQVRETMEFYARLKGVNPAMIEALLEELGLTEHARKPVSALSGGLRQRLALAVALLSDPPVLLLDEPLANLDAQARREYLALLASLRRRGKTLICASHRLEEVEVLADRVLVLERGRREAILTPAELRHQGPRDLQLILWVPEAHLQAALEAIEKEGLAVHRNGRGTLVAQVAQAQKLQVLLALSLQGILVTDFEVERTTPWT